MIFFAALFGAIVVWFIASKTTTNITTSTTFKVTTTTNKINHTSLADIKQNLTNSTDYPSTDIPSMKVEPITSFPRKNDFPLQVTSNIFTNILINGSVNSTSNLGITSSPITNFPSKFSNITATVYSTFVSTNEIHDRPVVYETKFFKIVFKNSIWTIYEYFRTFTRTEELTRIAPRNGFLLSFYSNERKVYYHLSKTKCGFLFYSATRLKDCGPVKWL